VYPANIDVAKGSYDYADNMKSNDASYTTFTSTHTDGYVYETPSQWADFTFTNGTGDTIGELETIDANWSVINSTKGVFVHDEYISSITVNYGTHYSGTVANTRTDDGNAWVGKCIYLYAMYWLDITFVFDTALAGRNFLVSAHIESTGTGGSLYMNGGLWKS